MSPYIKQEKRDFWNDLLLPIRALAPYAKLDDKKMFETVGELNYVITSIIKVFLEEYGESYTTYNSIVGVLECVKQEIYRRLIGKYEDQKIEENGDVF